MYVCGGDCQDAFLTIDNKTAHQVHCSVWHRYQRERASSPRAMARRSAVTKKTGRRLT
jgi:hypothetical protein